jgi:hypothetical protein
MADLDNVQALVARSSKRPFLAVLLFRIGALGKAREFLRLWTASTLGGEAPEVAGAGTFHFMFSWNGLAKLLDGNPQFDVAKGRAEFEPFFVDPKQAPDSLAAASDLGFIGESSPDGWWDGFKSGDIDLAIHMAFESEPQRKDDLDRVRTSAAKQDLQELQIRTFPDLALTGKLPPGGVLHFGYRDGITKPSIDWNDTGAATPDSINLRQVITGYPSKDYATNPWLPGVWQDFAREGSFACLTWLHQNVAKFNAFLRGNADQAKTYSGGADPQEWLAAKLLGRWRSGTPLALSPVDQPLNEDLINSDFGYSDDPTGLKCPVTAHIRIVNSRDQGLTDADRVRFPGGVVPRLIRRGFSYGEPLQTVEDDLQDRGLVGFFFCARVNEQFYTILRWMQQTTFSDVFDKIPDGSRRQDALFGNRSTPLSNPNFYVPHDKLPPLGLNLADFIRYRGVAILFAPGLKSLKLLAADN